MAVDDDDEIRPGKKNFGSGQLIFENWSGGPVDVFFFEPQPKYCREGCQCRGENLELSGAGCQALAADSRHPRHGESGVL